MPNRGFRVKTFLILIIFAIALGSFIYWLWQRQPKGLLANDQTLSRQTQNQEATSSAAQTSKVSVEGNKVLTLKKYQLQGQATPNSLVVIYSNSQSAVVKSDSNGKFTATLDFGDGLNLIGLSALDSNLKEVAATNLTYYVTGSKTDDTTVYAGLVKSIFKDTTTLTTQTGDATVKKAQDAKVTIPKLPGVEGQQQDQDIRVGDYMIALGKNVSEGQLIADNITILRDDKPQNIERWAIARILTSLSKNTFTAQQTGQSNTVKIATDTSTSFIDKDQTADSKAVVKDRTGIIIYHEDEKGNDTADLVYLLP